MKYYLKILLSLVFVPLIFSDTLLALDEKVDPSTQAQVEQKLGTTIDLSLPFTSQEGKQVTLKELFSKGIPVILTPVYYECPSLCTFTLNGTAEAVNSMSLKLGKDYQIVSYSINPKEGYQLANQKADAYYGELQDKAQERSGWSFLTGATSSIEPLSNQIGFHYTEDGGEYVHASTIIVLTPGGTISRYFGGVQYPARDVQLALVEASSGKIGSLSDRLFLFCFRYDHITGRYALIAWNAVRAVSVLVVVLLLSFLLAMRLRELRLEKKPTHV